MELMARTSPKCSMAGAMATGTMNRMACQLNSGKVNEGTANQGAAATGERSTSPKGMEIRYPTMIPLRMGMSLNTPLPNMETPMVVPRETMEMNRAMFSGTSTADPSPVLPM